MGTLDDLIKPLHSITRQFLSLNLMYASGFLFFYLYYADHLSESTVPFIFYETRVILVKEWYILYLLNLYNLNTAIEHLISVIQIKCAVLVVSACLIGTNLVKHPKLSCVPDFSNQILPIFLMRHYVFMSFFCFTATIQIKCKHYPA